MIYVSSRDNALYGYRGDDDNVGSQDAPKRTINAAIAALVSAGATTAQVRVAHGGYRTVGPIRLVEGISLYGGYSPADWSLRGPLYVSIISGISGTNSAIIADNSITSATIIDGFTLNHGGIPWLFYNSAIYVDIGNALTIQNNNINGGIDGVTDPNNPSYGITFRGSSSPSIIQNNTINGGRGATSYGISNISASPIIQNNTINGNNRSIYPYDFIGSIDSYGIINIESSSPTIRNNTINGGIGTFTCGISNSYSSSPTIQNNSINGGLLIDLLPIEGPGGQEELNSHGIRNELSSSPTIQNNIIYSGSSLPYPSTPSNTYGIFNIINSSPTIQNNIIFTEDLPWTSNYCIYGSDSVSVRNNDLFSCSTALYYYGLGRYITAIADVNALAGTTSSGNISVDPEFADIYGLDNDIATMEDNDWHLTASSPTNVIIGGIDGGPSGENWGFTTDKDGLTRTGDNTAGWSMGAYEYD